MIELPTERDRNRKWRLGGSTAALLGLVLGGLGGAPESTPDAQQSDIEERHSDV